MEAVEELYNKIFNFYHKTRLTHDIHFNLTVEETQILLEVLVLYKSV